MSDLNDREKFSDFATLIFDVCKKLENVDFYIHSPTRGINFFRAFIYVGQDFYVYCTAPCHFDIDQKGGDFAISSKDPETVVNFIRAHINLKEKEC